MTLIFVARPWNLINILDASYDPTNGALVNKGETAKQNNCQANERWFQRRRADKYRPDGLLQVHSDADTFCLMKLYAISSVSDEGDTSESSISGKEEIGFAEGAWTYTAREPIVSPQYLCAPPPTPTFVPLRSLELAKRRSKKGTTANRSYLRRRRMLVRSKKLL